MRVSPFLPKLAPPHFFLPRRSMSQEPVPTRAEARARFRRTLVKVLLVQLIAIAALAFLQIRYGV